MPILIPRIRTSRIDVTPRELTWGESISLCKMPPLAGAEESAFLRYICDGASSEGGRVSDPRMWTVQERTFVVCRYLSAVSPQANFAVHADSKLSDFIRGDADYTAPEVVIGEGSGAIRVTHMLGVHQELLERLCRDSGEWIFGAMACLTFMPDELEPDLGAMPDMEALKWVDDRIAATSRKPASEIEARLEAYWAGLGNLYHFFTVVFDNKGPCFARKGGGPESVPARFPVDTCLPNTARQLAGRAD
jgi:hypothetical protein